MKKLLVLVGLIVFLTPSLVLSNEKDLLGAHCIKEVEIDGEYDGQWINVSKQCESSDIPELQEMIDSSLSIKNNKIKFYGTIGTITDKKLKINVSLYGELIGTIDKMNAKLKFSNPRKSAENAWHSKVGQEKYKKILSDCTLEFIKDDKSLEIKKSINKPLSNTYCFCISPGYKFKGEVSKKRVGNNIQNYCSGNENKKISYNVYLDMGGENINTNNYVSVKNASRMTSKDISKWLKKAKKVHRENWNKMWRELKEVASKNKKNAKNECKEHKKVGGAYSLYCLMVLGTLSAGEYDSLVSDERWGSNSDKYCRNGRYKGKDLELNIEEYRKVHWTCKKNYKELGGLKPNDPLNEVSSWQPDSGGSESKSREKSFDEKFGKVNDTFTSQGFNQWANKWISGN